MSISIRSVALAALVVLCAAPLLAGDSWASLDKAKNSAVRADKPVFVLTILTGPYNPDASYGKMQDKAGDDEDAGAFVLATVNIYKFDLKAAQAGGSPYGQNKELAAKWGSSSTCSVLAPGADKPLWQLAGGAYKDDVFKQARKAYDTWRKGVDDVEDSIKKNRDLKKDADTMLKLANAWAAGYVAAAAAKNLDAAMKLVKKEDRKSPRLEKLALRRADILLDCEAYEDAAKDYASFVKHYRDSDSAAEAQLGLARALAGEGDRQGAIKAARELAKDDDAGDVKKDAEALLKELKKD